MGQCHLIINIYNCQANMVSLLIHQNINKQNGIKMMMMINMPVSLPDSANKNLKARNLHTSIRHEDMLMDV